MNIDKLVRKAVTEIKLKWGLPSEGFIAGGSVGNLVWKYHSGKEAIVNDIDVFLKTSSDNSFVFEYKEKQVRYSDHYLHFQQTIEIESKYRIYSTARDGMLNIVSVSSNATPQNILESFDINAVCVGYCIEEDKVYYLDSFIDFLNTGELKIVNLMTPAHTALRLQKKKYDLDAKLDEFEFRIVQYCLKNRGFNFDRFYFQNKYAELFEKYQEELSKFFKLEKCIDLQDWLLTNTKKTINLFNLTVVDTEEVNNFIQETSKILESAEFKPRIGILSKRKGDELKEHNTSVLDSLALKPHSPGSQTPKITLLITSSDVLFFFRNIYQNEMLCEAWAKVMPLIKTKDYLDGSTKEQLDYVSNFIQIFPGCINKLKDFKLNEQWKIITMVVQTIGKEYNVETAARVIEYYKIDPNKPIDEFDTTILGLSIRRRLRNKLMDEYLFEDPLPF